MADDTAGQPTQYLVAKIRDRLAHDDRVAALDIGVRVIGNEVFLTGSVATDARRRSCESVVQELLPDHTVRSQLVLLDQGAPSEPEELA
jgi:hypothetical protein